ncbi:hypothetical protein [Paraflavitalea speifideaquila]|uniref:hypothetical protein n=1 Tax=Paraflavitalea speifideaquila TaxID=3076558 RepID=UPI0028E347E0|nr:hypothetical protein [Paraflavitalea speifideiaquila]
MWHPIKLINLYLGDYDNAEKQSSWLIECGLYELEQNIDSVFLSGSKETIFALLPIIDNYNTAEGRIFGVNPKHAKRLLFIPGSTRQL